MKRHVIPAGCGLAVRLAAGKHLQVVNTHGTQVVDTWAFALDRRGEWLSMEHCREVLQSIAFEPGDKLVSNRYRPLLEVVTDTSPGGHDTLIAACSAEMYRRAGIEEPHRNCADNLREALAGFGMALGHTPSPWNLFMLAPVRDGKRIEYLRPRANPGDHVEIRAAVDCLMVFSACPDDVYPTNGGDGAPVDAHVVLPEG